MTGLDMLWIPILLSAIAVFIASSIIHMATPWHKSDFGKLPNEDAVMDALRPLAIPPGDYCTPRPNDGKDMRSPEFIAKMNKGPVMMLTMMPNAMMNMGQALIQWFVYCVIVGVFAAYIGGRALPVGADHARVMQFVAVTAFIGYALALSQSSIWYKRAWMATFKSSVDGLIYALLTGAIFAWLWP